MTHLPTRLPTHFANHLLTLALVPLLALSCSSSNGDGDGTDAGETATTSGAPGAQTVTIGMNDQLKFVPDSVAAKVGTVTFDVSNLGQVPHNLVFDDQALGKTGTVDGKTAEPLKVVFDKAGTFTFVCTFHSGMTGKVVVTAAAS